MKVLGHCNQSTSRLEHASNFLPPINHSLRSKCGPPFGAKRTFPPMRTHFHTNTTRLYTSFQRQLPQLSVEEAEVAPPNRKKSATAALRAAAKLRRELGGTNTLYCRHTNKSDIHDMVRRADINDRVARAYDELVRPTFILQARFT
jgi:hypothetical protein